MYFTDCCNDQHTVEYHTIGDFTGVLPLPNVTVKTSMPFVFHIPVLFFNPFAAIIKVVMPVAMNRSGVDMALLVNMFMALKVLVAVKDRVVVGLATVIL